MELNRKGLPIRPGETICGFYVKKGECRYGAVQITPHMLVGASPAVWRDNSNDDTSLMLLAQGHRVSSVILISFEHSASSYAADVLRCRPVLRSADLTKCTFTP